MKNTRIEWADHTFNPWEGCAKVSPGCANCYAERERDHRFGTVKWGKNGTRRKTSEAYWKQPHKWNQEAEQSGERPRVFCASLADVFEDREDLIPWRVELFHLINATPNLDWLLLTKRPENIERFHGGGGVKRSWSEYTPRNVWFGVSVENQKTADKRIPRLLKIPAAVHFVSYEPALGAVQFDPAWFNVVECGHQNNQYGLNWVIAGGESGSNSRTSHPAWLQSARDQCEAYEVPFFFKQWGEWIPKGQSSPELGRIHQDMYSSREGATVFSHREHLGGGGIDGVECFRVGKKSAGRLLDGVEHNAVPVNIEWRVSQ